MYIYIFWPGSAERAILFEWNSFCIHRPDGKGFGCWFLHPFRNRELGARRPAMSHATNLRLPIGISAFVGKSAFLKKDSATLSIDVIDLQT